MNSLTAVVTPKPPSLSYPLLSRHPLPFPLLSIRHHKTLLSKPISAAIILPSSSPNRSQQQKQLYQPFRPPPSPLPPKFRSLEINDRLEILTNRLGLWFEYAPLIPTLVPEGFSPSTIEELTGISGVEQNRLVVAAQVRESLVQSEANKETLEFFDTGGAELLYEIRLLSTRQREAAARYLLDKMLDAKGAQELARSMKDFPRRRGDRGWVNFDYNLPGDCLSFMYYRQSRENQDSIEQRNSSLEKALEAAVSERAKNWLLEELQRKEGKGQGERRGGENEEGVKVPIVRINRGEVAEATIVVVLPVCDERLGRERMGEESGVAEAPWECGLQGEFGVVVAEKPWGRWVVLPAWEPVAGLKRGGVAVSFSNARALPWMVNRGYKEEPILAVVDRKRKEVAADDGFFLVSGDDSGELKVERGSSLKESGVEESLGAVVLVVRPPREDAENLLADEDWE